MTPRSVRPLGALVALLAVASVAAAAATSAPAAPKRQTVLVLPSPNHTPANRTPRQIDQIVVHVTQGPYKQSIKWMRNRHGGGASHFIVSRRGAIAQLVSTSDIAWHAGNYANNTRSIGIEHAGFVLRTFPRVQYEASAKLVAYLVNRFEIPVDREHIIGHHEVPDPYEPGKLGGADGHWDPGPNWDWDLYMELIRTYAAEQRDEAPFEFVAPKRTSGVAPAPAPKQARAANPAPPPFAVPLSGGGAQPAAVEERHVPCYRAGVHATTLLDGQLVSGLVPWKTRHCGYVRRVEFLVDGEVKWVDRTGPFEFARGRGWNSTAVANGWHTLAMRAHGRNGYRILKRIRVKVDNTLYELKTSGVARGQAVRGEVELRAHPTADTWRVTLFVDGKARARSFRGDLGFRIDTSQLEPGRHELVLVANARDGRRAEKTFPIYAANPAPDAAERPPRVTWQSLVDWQTVRGAVAWEALVDGDVAQVEFWVDGVVRWIDREAPYRYGSPTWDTAATVGPGRHEVLVRAVGTRGAVAESRATIFVEAP